MERWPSGRRRLPAKQVWVFPTVGSNPTLSASFVPVAQLDRAIDCGSIGREFKSPRAHQVFGMFKLKLENLKKEKVVHINEELDWKFLELDGESYPYSEPIRVRIEASFLKGRIYVSGRVETVVIHPCDRCLEPVHLKINGRIEAFYIPEEKKSKQDRLEKSVELVELDNSFLYNPQDDFVDLEDRVIEAMVIEIPLKVLCKEGCKGLCPYCGVNLNEYPDHMCMHSSKEESPFAVLKDKFKN